MDSEAKNEVAQIEEVVPDSKLQITDSSQLSAFLTVDDASVRPGTVTEDLLAKMDLKLFKQPHDRPSKLMKEMVQVPKCLEADEEQLNLFQQDLDFFVCKSCNFIAKDPELCRKCQKLYCSKCTLQGNKKMCPSCKDDSQAGKQRITKLDAFATRHLQSLKFNCKYSDKCGKVNMRYDEAMTHLTRCIYEYYHCPFNCVQKQGLNYEKIIADGGILGADMLKHLDSCDYNQVECEKCGLLIVVKDRDQHDCLKELKKLIQEKECGLQVTKEEFGIDFERMNLRCDNNHPLTYCRGKPLSHAGYANGAQCNKCRQSFLEHMEYFYHCKTCNFDLCKGCALIKAKLLNTRIKSQLHKCELTFIQPSRGYRCDCGYERGSNNDLTEVKCLSGHISFYQGHYTQRWQCRPCDFDMCIKCVQKFAFMPIADITPKDCNLAYFVLQSSIFSGESDVNINRFLKVDEAKDYFLRIQRKAMNSHQVREEDKFGLLIHKGKVLAKYGSLNKINKLIEDIQTEGSFSRYKKLFCQQINDIQLNVDNVIYYANKRLQSKTSVITRMHKVGEKDAFYTVAQQDVMAQFSQGKLTMLQYISDDSDGKRVVNTDFIFEVAQKEGAYTPQEDAQCTPHAVYWIGKRKEGEGDAATYTNVIYQNMFDGEEQAQHFYTKLIAPSTLQKLLITNNQITDSNGDDEDIQLLIDKSTKDGTFKE